jgi:hypothetical protein
MLQSKRTLQEAPDKTDDENRADGERQMRWNRSAFRHVLKRMSPEQPFADLSLERAIELRWTLRDIQTDRLTLMPASDDDLNVLTELGLVEMQDGVPVVTPAGLALVE